MNYADTYYMNVYFNDPIPCATNPNNVSLAAALNLPSDIQSWTDRLSFEIGLQLGNYNGKFYSFFFFVPNPYHLLMFTQSRWQGTPQLLWQVVSMSKITMRMVR